MRLVLKNTKHGKGVFAGERVSKWENILNFTGPIVSRIHLPKPYDAYDDHYIQIDHDLYMGPSGQLDDLINHSCNPNSGVIITPDVVKLIAIKDIDQNEEITFDYSTTMDVDEWELKCGCDNALCRQKIRDFKYLDENIKRKYILLGIVPSFIAKQYQ